MYSLKEDKIIKAIKKEGYRVRLLMILIMFLGMNMVGIIFNKPEWTINYSWFTQSMFVLTFILSLL